MLMKNNSFLVYIFIHKMCQRDTPDWWLKDPD
jgi:hypothetical protein